jgi:thiosulfate/3-mercaptopyruvate sulfurtransferase
MEDIEERESRMLSRNSLGLKSRRINCAAFIALMALGTLSTRAQSQTAPQGNSATFSAAQLVQAADLIRELASANVDTRPTVVYVGFRTLFAGGHIPGATFHGTASTEQGRMEVTRWAASLPRTTNLVIYCGCCPFQRCPNIRPAFAILRDMGFTHVRVLELPNNFAADWADKNYPVEKGSS